MKKLITGILIWICLSFQWMLVLYCINWNSSIWMLGYDIRTFFRDCEGKMLVQLLAPIILFLALILYIQRKKKCIYVDLHIRFLNKKIFSHFCWLELLHKYINIIIAMCVIISVMFGNFAIRDWEKTRNRYQYLDKPLVIHAMGKINDDTYTNSLEAFEYHYLNGQRVFEVDFSVTSDGKLVARHDWGDGKQSGLDQEHIPTEKVFLQNKICGKYTPLSIEKLVKLMQTYEDVIIVTDTKDLEPQLAKEEISLIISAAKKLNADSVLERFVVQIYT